MLLELLDQLKKVDAQINFAKGVLEKIVGEELGVLPGMDSICSVLALQKLLNYFSAGRNSSQGEFDVVVYDCNNTEEILWVIGATERARYRLSLALTLPSLRALNLMLCYTKDRSHLRYVRDLAEKTDIGRLASPSLLKLIYDAARPNGRTSEGRLSTEIWNEIEQLLKRISLWFADPSKLACFLASQAGTQISGAFGYTEDPSEMHQEVVEKFLPLSFSFLPFLPYDSTTDWDRALNSVSQNTKELLRNTSNQVYLSVSFDFVQKSVTLFMLVLDKPETVHQA